MSLVSVIVPNYNHDAYLEQRIKSILDQSYQDFEILIFDDGSSDSSCEIIKKYQDNPKITFVEFSKKNSGGPFGAWEKGYQNAKGKYIWIAESDDLSEKSFLETQIESFKKHSDLIISFSASKWIDEKGEIIHSPGHEKNPYFEESGTCLQHELTKGTFIYNMSSALILREAFVHVDFAKLKTFKYVGDWYFWSKVMQYNGSIKRNPQALNLFRRHDSNVSFKADRKGLQFLEGFPILTNIINSTELSFFKKQRIFAFWAKKLYFSEIDNKSECLELLPFWGQFWYSIVPFIAKKPK